MKRFKSFLCILIVLCFSISVFGIYAENDDPAVKPDLFIGTEKVCVGLETSASNVVIESNGYSEFVDCYATLDDNTVINVNYDAKWETYNQNIAVAFEGRILAKGKGKTRIKVSYEGFEKYIDVEILKEIDLIKEEKALNEIFKSRKSNDDMLGTLSLTNSERQEIRDKAMAMIAYIWRPAKDLTGWKDLYTFEKDTTCIGIPYSQTPNQVDEAGFKSAQSKSDFYTSITSPNIMPRYGNDCSGFTSFSWGISRQTTLSFYNGIKKGTYPKVGSYNADTPTSPSASELKNSYKLLQTGDAVVYRTSDNTGGHVFVIAVNFTTDSKVQCFEQTDPYCDITYWTYDQLANRKYMPFAKK